MLVARYVVDASTPLAQEVGVRRGGGIVTGVTLVNGQCLGGSLLGKQFQRVVYSGLGERGYTGCQSGVYLIYRRMCAMLHQIAHDGDALQGGLDVMTLQPFDGIHSVLCF